MRRKHECLWDETMAEINITNNSIDLIPGARPIKSVPYRAGPKTRDLEQLEIEKQVNARLIELSNSEWAAQMLFEPEKDGRLRFCIEYHELKLMTIKDSYRIPRMD